MFSTKVEFAIRYTLPHFFCHPYLQGYFLSRNDLRTWIQSDCKKDEALCVTNSEKDFKNLHTFNSATEVTLAIV